MAWEKFDGIGIDDRRLTDACRKAVDDVTAAAAIYAKQNHPGWKNVTTHAEGSIRMEPAVVHGDIITGYFGSYNVDYFIWLEIGHHVLSMRGFDKHGRGSPEAAFGRFIPGDYTLRRAADAEFPSLGRRLAQRIGGLKA